MLKMWITNIWYHQTDLHAGLDLIFLISTWLVITNGVTLPSAHVIRIREGIPTGTTVIPDLQTFLKTGTQLSTDTHRTSTEDKENVVLAIGNSAMPGVSWFAIDPSRKSLVVKTPPDRDELCPTEFKLPETAVPMPNGGVEFPEYLIHSNLNLNAPGPSTECTLKISIVHGPASNPSFDILTIILEDVNDHAPTFSVADSSNGASTPHVIRVMEHPAPQVPKSKSTDTSHAIRDMIRIPLPLAKDLDYGANSIRGYRLEGQDAYMFGLEVGFSLEDQHSVNSDTSPIQFRRTKANQLWLVASNGRGQSTQAFPSGVLDREAREDYHFVLVAFDGGSPQRSARLPIHLIVEDINDNAPVFNQPWYSGQISENDPAGYVVFEFSAVDADSEVNNRKISFHIPGYSPTYSKQNGMRTETDHSVQQVTGLSESQLAAAQLFAIEQRNDVLADSGQFPSTTKPNATHARLVIRRQPKEQLQKVAYRAIEVAKRFTPNPLGAFHAESSAFPEPKIHPQHNSGVRLEFVMEAYDHGRPTSLHTRVPVYVNIIDVNDHPPEIFVSYLHPSTVSGVPHQDDSSGLLLWGKVRENLSRTMIAQITVTDEDATGDGGDLVCSTDDSRFVLEEIAPTGGFMGEPQNLWLSKSIRSMRKDNGDFQRMKRSAWNARMFKLMLVTPLDREARGGQSTRVEFHLTCRDNTHNQLPGEQLTSSVPIRMFIEDTNDNAPVFEHSEYSFHIPENHPQMSTETDGSMSKHSRYFVGQIRANDADDQDHALIEYQLVTNPSSAFELNSITGQLYVTRPLDRETTTEVVFPVLAIDCRPTNGSEITPTEKRLTATTQVRIIIDDLNDSPPIFDELNYHFEVEEGTDLAKVGQVWATDSDQGEAARISYRLAVGTPNRYADYAPSQSKSTAQSVNIPAQLYDEALEITTHFQIDPANGVIRVKGRLDRERRSHYEFIVLAVDNPRAGQIKSEHHFLSQPLDMVQHTATATILVTVLDQNDNPPQIHSPKNHAEFQLGSDQLIAGSTIFTIKSTDPDLGENGTIEFELIKVENDLGTWRAVNEHENSEQHSVGNQSITLDSLPSGEKLTYVDNPFALDRTTGMCYLRENLPPLNADGPRAYLLRIRAYDLGRPRSLNTSIVVRVVRNTAGSASQGTLINAIGERSRSSNSGNHERGYLGSEGDAKHGTWTSVGQARISDRTMVIILTTVFILLLLTTIVLLLLVRYRRLFLRNMSFNSVQSHDSPLSKANAGYTAGKPFSPHPEPNGSNGVLAAPWTTSPSSPVESQDSFHYSTICNPAGRLNAPMTPRMCIKNPSARWSPCSGTIRRSPGMHHNIHAESQLPMFQSTQSRTDGSPVYAMELRPRSQLHLHSKEHSFASPPTMPVDMPLTLIFENYAAHPERTDYRTLAMDSRSNTKLRHVAETTSELPRKKLRVLEPGNLVPDTSRGWPTASTHSTLRRSAFSLEDLHGTLDPSENNDYNKRSFTQSPHVAVGTTRTMGPPKETCPTHNDYQPLLTRDCTPLRSAHSSPHHRANNTHCLLLPNELRALKSTRTNNTAMSIKKPQLLMDHQSPILDMPGRCYLFSDELTETPTVRRDPLNQTAELFKRNKTNSQMLNGGDSAKSQSNRKSNLKSTGKKQKGLRFANSEEGQQQSRVFETEFGFSLDSSTPSDLLESFSSTNSPSKGIKNEELFFQPASPTKTASVHIHGSFV